MEMRANLLIVNEIKIMGVVKMLECYVVSIVARDQENSQLIIELPLHSTSGHVLSKVRLKHLHTVCNGYLQEMLSVLPVVQ